MSRRPRGSSSYHWDRGNFSTRGRGSGSADLRSEPSIGNYRGNRRGGSSRGRDGRTEENSQLYAIGRGNRGGRRGGRLPRYSGSGRRGDRRYYKDVASLLSDLAKDENSNDVMLDAWNSNLIDELRQAKSIKFSHLPNLFCALKNICLDETSPELKIKFLVTIIDSAFFKVRLSNLVKQNFRGMCDDGTMEKKELNEFLMDFFIVLHYLYQNYQPDCFEHLSHLIDEVQKTFRQMLIDHPKLIQFHVAQFHNRVIDAHEEAHTKALQNLSLNNNNNNVTDDSSKPPVLQFESTKLPNNFRELSVIPTAEDLFYDSKEIFIRANKVTGGYENSNDYLDVQFRLMREDFLSPLREGICDFLKRNHPVASKRKLNTVRLYCNVTIGISLPMVNSGVVHEILFQTIPRMNWDKTKRLIYGSLLCFSSDNFRSVYFGTVCERDVRTLERGRFYAKFVENFPPRGVSYTMLESVAYFEAYRHILVRLKEVKYNPLPFSDYLVNCSSNVAKPFYLRQEQTLKYDLKIITDDSGKGSFKSVNFAVYPSRVNAKWPKKEYLGLDSSQMKALQTALTNELVLIQGPPGTGKTYIGLKIFKVLCHSVQKRIPQFGPILVVCYTNHALDQFLEGIYDFLKRGDIVRVGGRSQSERMLACSLHSLKDKLRKKKRAPSNISRLMGETTRELNELKEDILAARQKIERASTHIVGLDRLSPHMELSHRRYLESRRGSRKSIILSWLLDETNNDAELEERTDWFPSFQSTRCVYQLGAANEFVDVEDETHWETRQRLIDDEEEDKAEYLRDLIRRTLPNEETEPMSVNPTAGEDGWQTVRRNNFIRGKLSGGRNSKMTANEVAQIQDLSELNSSERWRLYFYWLAKYTEELEISTETIEEEFESLSKRRKELRFQEDLELMRCCKVIGMTTTGAARYGRILSKLGCKIIVVEEAAEVLESHIITSLNEKCQHLILIGDHKQLRPSPAVYALAKNYNLEVSLFERLINNEVHYDTLQYQHRMRHDISSVMRFIYPDLKDHESVLLYKNIRGVAFNIYFLDHEHHECCSDDSTSHFNPFEADYAVGLCRHLLKNGYPPTDITILTLYSAQLYHIKEKMNSEEFQDVHLTSVDNYQGEENEIIILSLVRSNEKDQIGFLAVDNRVCVAMSRARNGLFVLGNSNLLSKSSKSKLWQDIIAHLTARQNLGKCLPLRCQIHHTDNPILAYTAKDFVQVPDGGCQRKCLRTLDCGHQCTLYCHPVDQEHQLFECKKPCERTRKCGHKCKKLCHLDCEPCLVPVEKYLPVCNHRQMIPCSALPEDFFCTTEVLKTVPNCLHKQKIPCGMSPTDFYCQVSCTNMLLCGHQCYKQCGEVCPDNCNRLVSKKLQFCGHSVSIPCGADPEYSVCPTLCDRKLLCGHKCKLSCGECANGRLHGLCREKCSRVLVCGHKCRGLCCDPCPPCSRSCYNKCSHGSCPKLCGHPCQDCVAPCQSQCPHQKCDKRCGDVTCGVNPCEERCASIVTCRHCDGSYRCIGLCGERCPRICSICQEKDLRSLLATYSSTHVNYEEARFITLWSCGHTFEVTYLDNWMQRKVGPVNSRMCPKCHARIDSTSTVRYTKIVKLFHTILQTIRNQYLAIQSVEFQGEEKNKVFISIITQENNLKELATFFQLSFLFDLPDKRIRPLLNNIHNTRQNSFVSQTSLTFYGALYKIFDGMRGAYIEREECYYHFYRSFQYFLMWLDPVSRNFTECEVSQALFELERLRLLSGVMKCNDWRWKFYSKLVTCRDEQQLMKLRSSLKLVASADRDQITVNCALSLQEKDWMICQDSHLYASTEWKDLNHQTNCPFCPIGRQK